MSTDLYLHAVSGITEEALLQMRLDDRWPNLPDPPRCFDLQTKHALWPKIEEKGTFRHRQNRRGLSSTRLARVGEPDLGHHVWIGHVEDFAALRDHVRSLEGPLVTGALIDWFGGIHQACLAEVKHEQPGFNSREFRAWLRSRRGARLFARVD